MRNSRAEHTSIGLQKALGWMALPWLAGAAIFYMRLVRGNRVENLREVRRRFREVAASDRPLLICVNHLTMVDSFYVHWALSSQLDYMLHYRRFAWNVPATENFQRGVLLRLMSYLGKTVPIDRAGSPTHHRAVLTQLAELLRSGDFVTIFPEGGRSRSGRVEVRDVAYGVGRILKDVPDARVLCVYLRGDRQDSWGFQPPRGDRIHVDLELIEPKTEHRGLRASRDLSRQVIEQLKRMEDRYFAERQRGS
ncbi:MAG: 1-acyl-sn-glycerol-3-phosphate acyltransferase [Polyangiaceae bacterium]|nr:1-acyl-sn-glycerol-3-phosphate acyltransferase [Polyangiaceae bacterium]